MATRNELNRKRFSNWLQCMYCLNDTKISLHDHVVETWKKEIMSWDKNIRDHIPRFFSCVSNGRVKVKPFKKGKKGNLFDDRKTFEKGKWICDCEHLFCNSILEKLLALQQNPGFNIVWNSNICQQLAEKGVEVESDEREDFDMGDDLENIPRVETALLTWKKDILSLDKDIADHIPRFLSCVSEERIKIQPCTERTEKGENIDGRKTNENGKWFSDCRHSYCNAILEKLLSLQQDPGFDIFSENPTGNCVELESGDADDNADESETVSKVETSLLALVLQMLFEVMGLMVIEEGVPAKAEAEEIDYEDIFNGCTKEHIWCIANMFMQRGKAKTNISNTGPANTDASMFFKMTKNCKLFEIENENYLYDDIIRCRDLLHHSASNRVNREEAETHIKTMIDLLKTFCDVPKCVDAIRKIEKMLKETILSVSVPDENLKELAAKALQLKKNGLEVDQEIDSATGLSNDDNRSLLNDTDEQIEIISNSQSDSPLNEGIKSREDFKQEILDYKNRTDEIQQKLTKLENENQILTNEIEKEIKTKEEYKREKLENKQRFDDMKEKAINLKNENQNLKDEVKKEMESNEEYEREKLETLQKLDTIKQKAMELEKEVEILKDQNKKEEESKEDYKREKLEYEQKFIEMKQNAVTLENENKALKDKNEKESFQCTAGEYVRMRDPGKHFENMTKIVKMHAGKEDILEVLREQLNPLLDQIVENASGKDQEIKESLESVHEEERHESEREKEEYRPSDSGDTPDKNFEVVSDFDEDIRGNQEECIEQETNGHESNKKYGETEVNNFGKTEELLDQIVEDASGNDKEIKESLDGIYEEERHEFEREKKENRPSDSCDTPGQTFEVASDFDDDISANQEECAEQETKGRDSDKDFEQTEVNNFGKTKETEAEDVDVQSPDMEAHDDSEHLKSHTQLRSDSGVTSTQANSSHVWSIESEQSYTIKVEGDRKDCCISGSCMLPTGEILLADHYNCRLKKLNDRYQVISVCKLPGRPWDMCYCGNNEAVLALYTKCLQFVDVTGGMSLTRKVRTDLQCRGLTCHGNQLYVVGYKYVYIYSTDGIKQRVLYTHHSAVLFMYIAVSDDGNYIYITDITTGLNTIDSVGNNLYTFTDTQLSEALAVCVDGEGHVLVSEAGSNKVLQASSDCKQKLGIIVDTLSEEFAIGTICFNRSNTTLIAAGHSNKIYVLKLK